MSSSAASASRRSLLGSSHASNSSCSRWSCSGVYLGCLSTRYVANARGGCAYPARTVGGALGASRPAPPVRTQRGRLVREARRYSTEALGRTCQLRRVHRSLGGLLAGVSGVLLAGRGRLLAQAGRGTTRVRQPVQPRALRRRAPRRLLPDEDDAVRVRPQEGGERLRGGGVGAGELDLIDRVPYCDVSGAGRASRVGLRRLRLWLDVASRREAQDGIELRLCQSALGGRVRTPLARGVVRHFGRGRCALVGAERGRAGTQYYAIPACESSLKRTRKKRGRYCPR
jgi:hypothetical protein